MRTGTMLLLGKSGFSKQIDLSKPCQEEGLDFLVEENEGMIAFEDRMCTL